MRTADGSVQLSVASTDWPALDQLLDEALALAADAQESWLARLPAEHAALRPTLERLLAARARVESADFLGTLPRGAPPSADADTPAPGTTVGPWTLQRELGQGGMGTVWLAGRSDGSLRREVALKLPRLTWDQGLAARMTRERDILARLVHPHIARLYDAGVDERGRPWLALEYVPGVPIDQYCRARALGTRDRLRLLLQVCDAVAYAHGRLVIHRDLKPANILVTDEGQVRLLDFGIGKLLHADDTAAGPLTAVAGRALTLDYASPEQVRGEPLGTASDVYSLGVMAYELLCGAQPYRLKRGSAAELEEAIQAADIPAASSRAADPALRRALQGDLDAILGKALQAQPTARYDSVAAFADDLQRHLRLEPVRARPERWTYRLGRALRRHRLEAVAASVVALALLAGTGLAAWQARQANEERAHAQEVRDFMLSIFTGTDLSFGGGSDVSAAGLLRQAEKRIDANVEARAATAAELLLVVSQSADSLGDGELKQRAIERASRLAAAPGVPAPLRARVASALAAGLADAEQWDEALRVARQVLATTPDDDRAFAVARLDALGVLANKHYNHGEFDAMQEQLLESTRLADRLLGPDHVETLNRWALRSHYLSLAEQPEQALAAARQADALASRQFPDGRNLQAVTARIGLATALASGGKAAEGLPLAELAVENARRFIEADSLPWSWLQTELAGVREAAGDLPGALAAAREGVRALRTVAVPPPRVAAERIHNLGYYGMLNRTPDATEALAEAVGRWETLVGPEHQHTVTARTYLALVWARRGDRERALAALPVLKQPEAWDHRQRAELWWILGDAVRAEEAVAALGPPPGPGAALDASQARVLRVHALVQSMRAPAAAADALARAAAALQAVLPGPALELADVWEALARGQRAAGDPARAAESFARAQAIQARFPGALEAQR